MSALEEAPVCDCHERPMRWRKDRRFKAGGRWVCVARVRESYRRYDNERYHNDPGFARQKNRERNLRAKRARLAQKLQRVGELRRAEAEGEA